jgi:hypothetical protein
VDDLSRNQAVGQGLIFPSGPVVFIPLPPTAPIAEVTAQAFKYSMADESVGTNFSILTTRQVRICGREELARHNNVYYTAVLVRTPGGERIVLLQPNGSGGWWNRVYAAK